MDAFARFCSKSAFGWRTISALVLRILYHLPSANKSTMLQYLQSSLELLGIKYPNCGLILAGNFNKLPIRHLSSQFQLKQMVNFNTRGTSKLDLILINLSDFYDQPLSSPPLGLSDHLTIVALAKQRIHSNQSKKTFYVRDKRPSSIHRLGRFLCEVPWDFVVNSSQYCNQNLSNFTDIINYGLDTLAPLKAVKVLHNDQPWMNSNLKCLIKKRQEAFAQNNHTLYKQLRNKVNRSRKICRKLYYEAKVKDLKYNKLKDCGREVKRLCGHQVTSTSNIFVNLEKDTQDLDSLSNLINDCFLEPMRHYEP